MIEDFNIEQIDTSADIKKKADNFMHTILMSAAYFEQTTHRKPTVFMSGDIFALLAYYHRDTITIAYKQPETICGYDIQRIVGTGLLYLGYRVNNPFLEE